MVGLDARVLSFPATTLWYFKASAPIKMKEGGNNSPREVATQTEKDVKLLLPIKTAEVYVIGFLSFFALPPAPFYSLHLPPTNTGTCALYPPLTPAPPLSDHFILHTNPC